MRVKHVRKYLIKLNASIIVNDVIRYVGYISPVDYEKQKTGLN